MSDSGSIVVSNYTNHPIDIVSIQDAAVADGERKKVHTVSPRDSYVIFLDRVENIYWEKQKG